MSDSMRRIFRVAQHEYRAAIRSRILLALLLILIIATAVSVYVGALDYASQLAEYNAYRAAAEAQGLTRIAPSPLAVLSLLRGGYEYLEIIGAIIAIALGYLSVARERANRTLRLLLSRPLTPGELATGNFLGAVGIFATLAVGTTVASVIALGTIGHDWINGTQILKLLLASIATVLYLAAFYCIGAICAALSRNAANGLIVALGIWLLIVLVLPQIGDTMDADNQLPGGLFQAVGLNHDGEVAVLQHFTGYERIRTGIESLSLAKHFERFAFAMSDVKDRYRPYGISWLINETRNDIGWLVVAVTALFFGLKRAVSRRHTTQTGGNL